MNQPDLGSLPYHTALYWLVLEALDLIPPGEARNDAFCDFMEAITGTRSYAEVIEVCQFALDKHVPQVYSRSGLHVMLVADDMVEQAAPGSFWREIDKHMPAVYADGGAINDIELDCFLN